MLDEFRTNRQILFDLTANYLEPLDGAFARLAYMQSLRETSGRYTHERLSTAYDPDRVSQVLAQCHEEVFERLLEMPLNTQEQDLRRYLNAQTGCLEEKVNRCREGGRLWIPPQAPTYLKELFCSNLNALLEMLLDDPTKARSNT